MNKIFTADKPELGLDLLDQSGLLREVLPDVAALHGVEQPPQFHPEGDVYTHVRLMLSKIEHPDLDLALALSPASPLAVEAEGGSLDDVEAEVTFDDGFTARFHASRVAAAPSRSMRIVYACSLGQFYRPGPPRHPMATGVGCTAPAWTRVRLACSA